MAKKKKRPSYIQPVMTLPQEDAFTHQPFSAMDYITNYRPMLYAVRRTMKVARALGWKRD